MAKYNVGDVLEITEDFRMECAEYSRGEKFTITEVDLEGNTYYLNNGVVYFGNTLAKVDSHTGFRKVEPMVVFKVGDRVQVTKTLSDDYEFFKVGDTGTITLVPGDADRALWYRVQFDEPVTFGAGNWWIEEGAEIELLKPMEDPEPESLTVWAYQVQKSINKASEELAEPTVTLAQLTEAYDFLDVENEVDLAQLFKLATRLK